MTAFWRSIPEDYIEAFYVANKGSEKMGDPDKCYAPESECSGFGI